MRQLPAGDLVVDASFVLAVVDKTPSAMRFKSVLGRSRLSAANFGEVVYKLHQRANIAPRGTAGFLASQNVKIDDLTLPTVMRFAALKEIDGLAVIAQEKAGAHTIKTLSFADMCCLAHALERDLPLLTGDKHWLSLAAHGLVVPVFDFRDADVTP